MNNLEYLKNVVTLQVNPELCVGCGTCLEVCPHAVLSLSGGKRIGIANRDACMECGACSRNCPVGAVSVVAGVGCAAGVINGMLNRGGSDCCCYVAPQDSAEKSARGGTCC